jgi:hypothetical protein
MKLRVECYAGHRAEEEPRAIEIDGRRLRVLGIARRWQDVGARYFQIRAEDGHRYLLRHDEQRDEWTLVSVRESSG